MNFLEVIRTTNYYILIQRYLNMIRHYLFKISKEMILLRFHQALEFIYELLLEEI